MTKMTNKQERLFNLLQKLLRRPSLRWSSLFKNFLMLSKTHFLQEFDTTNHVMVDIETLSTENTAVIVQISAVQFNPFTGETLKTFDVNIDPQSAIDLGLNVSWSTLKFWLSQEKSAIDSVFMKSSVHLSHALNAFNIFVKSCSSSEKECNTRIWGNGPSFDCSKLKSSYSAARIQLPWIYWNERCVRTIVSFNPTFKKEQVFTGIKHYGLDDCKHQIKFVASGLQALVAPEEIEQIEPETVKES